MNAHAPLTVPRRPAPAKPRRWAYALAAGGAALGALAVANGRAAARAESETPPLGRFEEVDGVRLHLIDRGPDEDRGHPPVVVLHGNGSLIQDPLSSGLVDGLARTRRVIVFDRPGFGHSGRPRGRLWTPEAQADLLAQALRRMGALDATILGHSWGCLVAVALARRHPDVAGALVLEGGYFFPSLRLDVAAMAVPAVPALGDALRWTVSPPLARALWPLMMRKVFGPAPVPARWEGFPRAMALRPSQLRAAAEESALMIPAAGRAATHYGDLRLPVAILAGEGDRIADPRAQSERLHHAIPGSTLRLVPGAGHMLHQTAPDVVREAVEGVRG